MLELAARLTWAPYVVVCGDRLHTFRGSPDGFSNLESRTVPAGTAGANLWVLSPKTGPHFVVCGS